MKIQYIVTEKEIKAVKDRLYELRQAALMSRSCGEVGDSREFYLRAKGYEEALTTLGIVQPQKY